MNSFSASSRFLLLTAAFVVVIAGMKAAAPVLNPFLLSVFIAIISAPPMFFLQRKGLPILFALLAVVLGIISILFLLVALIGNSLEEFRQMMPLYQSALQQQLASTVQWLSGIGIMISLPKVQTYFDPALVMKLAVDTLSSLGNILANGFLILLTVVFMLSEASGFPSKLRSALQRPDQSLASFDHFLQTVKRYMVIKTWASLATGIIVFFMLWLIGVDYSLLWGVAAFFLNYVPNIGSIIAAIPPILLALIEMGFGAAVSVAVVYLVLNLVIGSIIEPRYMGKGLGLSTLVVFLSLVFWGWVLGVVGMLLSVPLTMMIKIAMASHEDTRWLAILLDSESPGEPDNNRG